MNMMNNLIKCERCERSLYDSSFFRHKETRKLYPICKQCINKEITENGKLALYKWTEEFNIPFIEKEWEYTKRYGEGLFSKYLGIMYLPAYRKFTYEDSKIFNQKEE
jgi:hypothetical protein